MLPVRIDEHVFRALEDVLSSDDKALIEDIDEFDSKMKPKFNDTIDDATEPLLAELKTTIQHTLPSENIFTYRVRWCDESSRSIYLIQFKDDFYTAIQRQIDYHMTKTRTKEILYDEVLEHAIQCKTLNERYFPRDYLLAQIKSYVLSNETRPCTIYGESGTGKSSIMAEVAIKSPDWFPDPSSVSIIFRFLGTTPLSSDIRRPLFSIMKQICLIYHLEMPSVDEFSKPEVLKKKLERLLTLIPTSERLILLFDSIDQLQVEDYDCSKWLLTKYPQNIKCILSTIPTISDKKRDPPATYEILNGLKSLLADAPMVQITEFDEQSAMQVFQSWLKRDHRRLTSLQISWLEPKLQPHTVFTGFYETDSEPTPLFLSLIYDITLQWHSYDENPDEDFNGVETTSTAINYLYTQLSKKHNEVFFKRAMAYLQQAGGLSEIELEDMLSADNTVLQAIFVHYLPPLHTFRIPSTLWVRIRNDMQNYLTEKDIDNTPVIYFYHRSFRDYEVLDGEESKSVDLIRCAYFADNTAGYPNLLEQPFEIRSRKLIERNNGISTLLVDRRLTQQSPYIFRNKQQHCTYNMRRINQLCAVIRVTLENKSTHYILANAKYDEENIAYEVSFNTIAVLKDPPGRESVFFNSETDVYYSEGQCDLFFYHFNRPEDSRLEKIGPSPPVHHQPFSRQFFSRKLHDTLIWLSTNSIVVFHSCGNHFIIHGEYRSVDAPSDLSIRNDCHDSICCLHQNASVIDIHSLGHTFFIIDGEKCQLLRIDTQSPFKLQTVTHIKFSIDIQLTFTLAEQSKLFIVSRDYSSLAIWNANSNTLTYQSIPFDRHPRINRILALPSALVYRDSEAQVYLYESEPEMKRILLGRADVFESIGQRLALFDQANRRLIMYDVSRKLRGTIRLRTPLKTLCFTGDGQYLLGISCEKSLLLMYSVNNGKLLQKLFFDNLSPWLQATTDRLVLYRRNELVLLVVAGKGVTLPDSSLRETSPLFENKQWFDCHLKKEWTKAS
ncbi:unnamed protein product [Didymodactylos carnosus]|uniref:NACHT domain-containing protein n=1 Tax=Didymodactylos carnosus TaxID=1234261 RepID=A0A814HHG0_9BILA|nr:unnamed protein product [Didymodactylos carnosus]CAF1010127.1 unnamed protein product [Didymodactylos carnosus]CAF3718873.1 unnamed protein product [Didymodactylos carnosus]CAF3781392.1 unnamed protein product [Didymodactylos carnosus]